MFVVIEGIDGTGKTTVIPTVVRLLGDRGIVAATKQEFPLGELSNTFRDALGKGLFLAEHLRMSPAAAFFYLLYSEVTAIEQALHQRADVLLADRYLFTHAMYQAYFAVQPTQELDPIAVHDCLMEIFRILQLPLPDLVFVLDAPIEVLVNRLSLRESRKISKREESVLDFFRAAYRSLVLSNPSSSFLIDATMDSSAVGQIIASSIASRMDMVGRGE